MAKFSFSFSGLINKIGNFFGYAWDVIRLIANCIGLVFAVIMIGIIYLFSIIFVYNWIMFPIWALARPKSTAEGMTSDPGTVSAWDDFYKFVTPCLAWEIRLLPWYARKYFIGRMPEVFDKVDLVKYYRRAEDKAEAFKLFDGREDAKSYLWYKLHDGERDGYLKIVNVWTNDMLKYAIENDLKAEIREYFKTNTPSEGHYYLLLSSVGAKVWLMPIIASCIKKHGLKQSIVDDIFVDGSKELKETINNALETFAQVTFVKAHQNINNSAIDWGVFCARTKDICPEAEMEMIPWMTDSFYRANHRMSEKAICYFCKAAYENSIYESIAQTVFAEQGDDCRKSEHIMALINSRPNLKNLFVAIANES